MRRESLYLNDIVEATDHIAEFIAGAVVQKLAIIREAAARVSEELKTRQPAHFGIDWDVVWRAARNRCPVLREQVARILASESAGPEDEGGRL
jgi:uncharacterized protein with HEPN domain